MVNKYLPLLVVINRSNAQRKYKRYEHTTFFYDLHCNTNVVVVTTRKIEFGKASYSLKIDREIKIEEILSPSQSKIEPS